MLVSAKSANELDLRFVTMLVTLQIEALAHFFQFYCEMG